MKFLQKQVVRAVDLLETFANFFKKSSVDDSIILKSGVDDSIILKSSVDDSTLTLNLRGGS